MKAWERKSLNERREETLTNRANSLVTESIRSPDQVKDILYSVDLSEAEKRSAWRYFFYRFPMYTETTNAEDGDLRLLLKDRLTASDRTRILATLK